MFTTDTKAKILEFIRQNGPANGGATNQQLRTLTGISQVGISQHLRGLLNQGKIAKSGRHPRHTYHISQAEINRMAYLRQKEALAVVGDFKSKFLQDITDQIKTSKDIPDDQKAKMLESFTNKLSKGDLPTGR